MGKQDIKSLIQQQGTPCQPPQVPTPKPGTSLIPSVTYSVIAAPLPPRNPRGGQLVPKVTFVQMEPFDGSDNRGYRSREGVEPLVEVKVKQQGEVIHPYPAPSSPQDGISSLAVVSAFLDAAVDNAHTRRSYRRHLAHAFEVMGLDDLRRLSGRDLAAFRAHLMADGRGVATHSQCLAAVRAFLRWVCGTFGMNQFSAHLLEATLRSPRSSVVKPYQILTDDEVDRVLLTTRTTRDRAIVMVFLGAGLRVAELVALDIQDLHSDVDGGEVLHVRGGKGSKDRLVPVHREVGFAVHRYLLSSGRTTSSPGPLFLSEDCGGSQRQHRRISQRGIRKLIRTLTIKAGIAKQISPHSFRHTYAIRGLRFSGNAVAVSKLLGHASVATTQTYLNHLGLGELRAAVPHIPSNMDQGSPG